MVSAWYLPLRSVNTNPKCGLSWFGLNERNESSLERVGLTWDNCPPHNESSLSHLVAVLFASLHWGYDDDVTSRLIINGVEMNSMNKKESIRSEMMLNEREHCALCCKWMQMKNTWQLHEVASNERGNYLLWFIYIWWLHRFHTTLYTCFNASSKRWTTKQLPQCYTIRLASGCFG